MKRDKIRAALDVVQHFFGHVGEPPKQNSRCALNFLDRSNSMEEQTPEMVYVHGAQNAGQTSLAMQYAVTKVRSGWLCREGQPIDRTACCRSGIPVLSRVDTA